MTGARPSGRCQVCRADALAEVRGYSVLGRVTSDAKPFRAGGRLWKCGACGSIQSVPDDRWLAESAEIYGNYEIYHQSGGVEQSVFDAETGRPRRRGAVLAGRLAEAAGLGPEGRLLDVGCGNGAMLEAFAAERPDWILDGLDLDQRNLDRLRKIPGFRTLHTGAPDAIPGGFDMITLVHSLEHIRAPDEALATIRRKLAAGGQLFIQVPDAARNPFDLVVADHLCHFTADTLRLLVNREGFDVQTLTTEWVAKELSVLARPGAAAATGGDVIRRALGAGGDSGHVEWLLAIVDDARQAAAARASFGIFGTSIAATWLFGHLGEQVAFFVDEDPARVGGRHFGRPIWRPAEVPAGACVYLALAPDVAISVRRRLRMLPIELKLSPPLPTGEREA